MKKRGQIFLEFLGTYGWAIIALLVTFGTLAYFGVVNPGKFLPERCLLGVVGVSCDDFAIYSTGEVFIEAANNLGKDMKNVKVDVKDKDKNVICSLDGASVIKEGEKVTYVSDPNKPGNENCRFNPGELVQLGLSIRYETDSFSGGGGGIEHTIEGDLVGTVQVGPPPECGDKICNGEETCSTCSLDCGACPPPGGPICGNGAIDPGEVCDGSNLGGQTCESQGRGAGTLVCNADCSGFDTSGCGGGAPICGNGILESGEVCDDGNVVNGDGCSNSCKIEFCGDNLCNGAETCSTCPTDCGICSPGIGVGPNDTCFLSGTLILTLESDIEIQNVKVGDIILSYNEETGVLEPSKVVQTFVHTTDTYLIINNNLKVTPNHHMYINGNWQPIGNAKKGDKIKTALGEEIIYSIKSINENVQVYNLEVKTNNNYYAQGYLAHNKAVICGDGICNSQLGENIRNCPLDCFV